MTMQQERQERLAANINSVYSNYLNLSKNNLGEKSDAELIEILSAIPAIVTTLDLGKNDLGKKSGAELAQILVAIPATVTTLDLSKNNFGEKSDTELTEILAAIPATIKTLNLSGNNLEKQSGAALVRAFVAITAAVTTLNLSSNYFSCLKSTAELTEILAAIPVTVTSLDLSNSQLYRKSGAALDLAFAAIPATITTLNLTKNCLGQSEAELAKILAAIPATVTTLNLSSNDLGKLTANLADALKRIPVTVTTLDLSYNYLSYLKSCSELVEIVDAIPATVKTINLSSNNLYQKSAAELAKIFAAVKANDVISCGCDYDTYTDDELRLILSALLHHVQIGKHINRQPFFERVLLQTVSDHVHSENPMFAWNLLPAEYSASENMSKKLIDGLRYYCSPIANLTIALLLNDDCISINGLHENMKDMVEAAHCFLDSLKDHQHLPFVQTAFAFMHNLFAHEGRLNVNSDRGHFFDYIDRVCVTIDAKPAVALFTGAYAKFKQRTWSAPKFVLKTNEAQSYDCIPKFEYGLRGRL